MAFRSLTPLFVFAALLTRAPGARACAEPNSMVVTQARRVTLAGRILHVAALTIPAEGGDDYARLVVRDRRCRLVWSATVVGLESRFDVRQLGALRLLQFVTMEPAGDGTGYVHRLLAFNQGRHLMAQFRHTGKDGFYFGRLAGGEWGVVTWEADNSDETYGSPHPFVVSTWRWRNGRLAGPVRYKTRLKYAAPDGALSRADWVARAIGLPYRDQTDTPPFMDVDKVLDALSAKAATDPISAPRPAEVQSDPRQ